MQAAWRASQAAPLTGRRPGRSKQRLALARRRRNLCKLRSLLRDLITHPKLTWSNHHDLQLKVGRCHADVNPKSWGPPASNLPTWFSNVRKQVNIVRREERKYAASLRDYVPDSWDHNPTAFVHRMMDGDRPPDIRSVVDPLSGYLATEPAEVKRVLHDHYAQVFAHRPRLGPAPAWIDEVNRPNDNINPDWYRHLMDTVTADDVTAALSGAKSVCAPGADRISSGVWRVLTRSPAVSEAVGLLLTGCLTNQCRSAFS